MKIIDYTPYETTTTSVTTESESIAYNEGFYGGYKVALSEMDAKEWTPVSEGLPESGKHVLVTCKFGLGKYVCDAMWTAKLSVECSIESDIDSDYDEGTDAFYFPEGWWEIIKNWGDYNYIAICDHVTAWMPLPEPYEEGKK